MNYQNELFYLKALDAATKETGLILFEPLIAGRWLFDPSLGNRYVVYDDIVQRHVLLTSEGQAYYGDGTTFPFQIAGRG